ncbi:hypothetical protein [Chondromyces apiculatus]|nr:hypothetical protein [Chondromyces apiculatus]
MNELTERDSLLVERYTLMTWATRHLRGVTADSVSAPDQAPAHELPAHARGILERLRYWHVRWTSTEGRYAGGFVPVCKAWLKGDPAYGFPPGKAFMVLDKHPDGAAFFVRDADAPVDSACVMVARAGEEGNATTVGATLADYLEKAMDWHFAARWWTGAAEAAEASRWLAAQPPVDQFAVRVVAVEEVTSASLRALRLRWLGLQHRQEVAKALKLEPGAASDIAALDAELAPPRGLMRRKEKAVRKALLMSEQTPEDLQRFFWTQASPGDATLVVLDVTRLGTAHLGVHALRPQAQHLAQLLLDAPGAGALLRMIGERVTGEEARDDARDGSMIGKRPTGETLVSDRPAGVERVRFALSMPDEALRGVVLDTFIDLSGAAPPQGKVRGRVQLAAVLPRALVPEGCVPGAAWTSGAFAFTGVMINGGVMQSG